MWKVLTEREVVRCVACVHVVFGVANPSDPGLCRPSDGQCSVVRSRLRAANAGALSDSIRTEKEFVSHSGVRDESLNLQRATVETSDVRRWKAVFECR